MKYKNSLKITILLCLNYKLSDSLCMYRLFDLDNIYCVINLNFFLDHKLDEI